MLLSLSKRPHLEIDIESMEEAIKLCEMLIGNIRRITVGKTSDEGTNAIRKTILLQELMERDNHMISRAQLNKKFWIQGNVNEWDECALSFETAGILKIETMGNQIVYKMTDESYDEMKKFFEGKAK
jgi:hypothetical protein